MSTTAPVPDDWKEFVECLNANCVEYLLVGGHAVAVHGLPRLTKDLDFFLRQTEANATRVVAALKDFGFGSLGVKVQDLLMPGSFIMLGHPPLQIDLITSIAGVAFEEAWSDRLETTLAGKTVHVISKQHLLINKRAAGRPQDLADAARLAALDTD